MKILKAILIGGAAFFGGRYLFSLNRAGKKVVVSVGARVHKVSLEGVQVVLNYNIKNPTKTSIEMAAPLIKLMHNGKVLASSSMALVEIPKNVRSDKGIKILANKETGNITTSILIPTLSIIGTGANLLTILKNRLKPDSENKETVKFEIETTSTVFTKIASFPYDDKTIIEV